jgi:hypothetical protein
MRSGYQIRHPLTLVMTAGTETDRKTTFMGSYGECPEGRR